MENIVLTYSKNLNEKKVVSKFLKDQLANLEKDQKKITDDFTEMLHSRLETWFSEADPTFHDYLTQTIAKFPTLNECYYYKEQSDTDTITLKSYFIELLR